MEPTIDTTLQAPASKEKILFQPTSKQAEFIQQVFQDDITFAAYGGAAGGGKTFCGIGLLVLFCKLYPGSRWAVIRRSLTEIRLNTLPSFWKVVPTNFIQTYNKSEFVCTFKNGSSILFKGENFHDDPELLWMDGLEVNGFLLEQCEELAEATFNKAKLRAGRNVIDSKPPIKILLTFNPTNNWVRKRFHEANQRGQIVPPYCYVVAKISDNPHLTTEYVKGLEHLDFITREKYVEGNWDVGREGTLFKLPELNKFSMKDLDLTKAEAIFGYGDPADDGTDSFSFPVAYLYPGKVYITDVIFDTANTSIVLPRIAALIKAQERWIESRKNKGKRVLVQELNFARIETIGVGSVVKKQLVGMVRRGDEKILSVKNTTRKHTRILLEEAFIRKHVYFLVETEIRPDSDYERFMRNLLDYMKDGSAAHDDAPDSLAGLATMCRSFMSHLFNLSEEESTEKELEEISDEDDTEY